MKNYRGLILFSAVSMAFVLSLGEFGFFKTELVTRGSSNALRFLIQAFPPDFSAWPNMLSALGETIQMAFAGTLLGFFIAFPVAVFGARIFFSARIVALSRACAGGLRTVPPLLWAIIFVIIAGLGPLAGTLSLALYTAGYLSKIYSELLEGTDPEVLEAVKGAGATTPYLIRYAALPEHANAMLSQLLFMFEYNIRASSILGFVGAGGIGFQIHVYLQTLEYQKLMAVLILIFAIVMAMDYVGSRIRSQYLLRTVKI